MSRADNRDTRPRAMVHRRILDVAASRPDATLSAIAGEVSGASPSLVERVLDEYGDPAGEDPDDSPGASTGSTADSQADEDPTGETEGAPGDGDAAAETGGVLTDESTPDPPVADESSDEQADGDRGGGGQGGLTTGEERADDASRDTDRNDPAMAARTNGRQADDRTDEQETELSLSERQRRTLRAVYERPDASQSDIAEVLDVTRATVSRRLNAIPGFEWDDRRSFAGSVFGDEAGGEEADGDATDGDGRDATDGAGRDDHGSPAGATVTDERERLDDETVRRTLDRLERRLAALEDGDGADAGDESPVATLSLTPELAQKALRVCLDSDRITDDEERELLRAAVDA